MHVLVLIVRLIFYNLVSLNLYSRIELWQADNKEKAQRAGQADTQSYTQTNCNENITPPRFRGGVIIVFNACTSTNCWIDFLQPCVLESSSLL